MGDDDERMFAGKVGIDEKCTQTVRAGLSPWDADEFFVHLYCSCRRRQQKEEKNEIGDVGLWRHR